MKTPEQIAEEIVKHVWFLMKEEEAREFIFKEVAEFIREDRERRLVWPSEEEIEKTAESLEFCVGKVGALNMAYWLKSVVKYAPKEQVSDEELNRLHSEYNETFPGSREVWKAGYRAAEKKARGE